VNKNANPLISKKPQFIAGLLSFPLLVIIFLVIGIALVGWLYFRDYESDYRAEVDRQLLAITELKVIEIDRWRQERLGDAMAIYHNPAFSDLTRRVLNDSTDMKSRLELQSWLANLQDYYQYERVFLLDHAGNELFSVPFAFPMEAAPDLLARLPSILESGQVEFWGFHRDSPDNPFHLGTLIPILDEKNDDQALGLLVMRISPDSSLFPAIARWPIPSKSGEAMLIRRESDEVIFLSRQQAPLGISTEKRFLLSQGDLVFVKAALGKRGIVEGKDDLGNEAIAAVQPVPGTDWLLLAKIDRDEVYSVIQTRLWPALIALSLIFLIAGLFAGRAWRSHQMAHLRERLQAANLLRQSERRLRHAQRLAQVGDWEVDLQTNSSVWSDQVYRLLGLEPGEIEPDFELVRSFTHPDDQEKWVEAIQKTMQEGDPFSMDYRGVRRNGEIFWVHNEAEVIRDSSGQVIKLIGIIQDITTRKMNEQAVRESDARVRAVLNASSDVIFLLGMDGKILAANQAFASLVQKDLDEIFGSSVYEYLPAEMAETRRERLRTIAENGQPLRFQSEQRDRIILESLYPIFGTEGRVTGVAIFGLDLTEQIQLAQDLRRSEAMLRTIAANFPHSYISIIEKDLTVGFTSGQEFSRLNLNPDDFVGLTLEQVFGEHTTLVKEHYLLTFLGEETEFELFINGQYQLYRTVPLYDPSGEIQRILVVVENISERKAAEKSLLKNYERMQALMNILQFDPQDVQELLDYALNEAVRLTGSQLGFIDTYDENKQEFIMKSWSREVMAECAVPGLETVFRLEEAGLWGEAVRQRKPILVNDYPAHNPLKKGYPAGHVHLEKFLTTPVFDQGRIVAVIGVANKEEDYDQTDVLQLELLMDAVWKGVQKRQATLELRRARDDWERTFNTIPDLIALIDIDHRFTRVNQAMAERLGLSPDEMVGKTCYEIVHCTDHPPDACPLSKMLTSRTIEQTEMEEQNLSGMFDIIVTPMYDDEGNLAGCVHVARDISAAKEAEEKLRNSEERLRLALKATNDVVWDWDVIKDAQLWNEAGTRVFGWTEIVEHPVSAGWWLERVHPDARQRVNDRFFEVVNNPDNTHWQDEYRFIRTDGSYADVLDRGYVLRDSEGKAVRMIGAMLDITERKLAEEEIRKALADNQALLRELYHRTKNNMYVISSMLAYQSAILPDERLQRVVLETENRIRAMALVHEMLYQSQSLSRIDFSVYLRELLGYLQISYSSASKNINLNLELAPVELLIDYAVPSGLVVNELVVNAFKHAFPNGRSGQVNIRLARIGKNEVELEIQDDGVGFPPGFDPKKATTMGLQIVRRTVEHQLGGKLDFRPTSGVHCRIRFRDIEHHDPIR